VPIATVDVEEGLRLSTAFEVRFARGTACLEHREEQLRAMEAFDMGDLSEGQV
jgi:hypothetical protein